MHQTGDLEPVLLDSHALGAFDGIVVRPVKGIESFPLVLANFTLRRHRNAYDRDHGDEHRKDPNEVFHDQPSMDIVYFRVMAFSGQISWQQKQVMHSSAST